MLSGAAPRESDRATAAARGSKAADGGKICVAEPPVSCCPVRLQNVTNLFPAIAVIDGTLCRLNRTGTVAAALQPLATGVLEFRHGPMRLYVREHPFGLLPGVPNVYCVDANFRLLWLAEWPLADDPCAKIVDEAGDTLVLESASGTTVQLAAGTGRLIHCSRPMAAAS